MSQFKYNYGKAFALFVQGHPLEEVADQCQMPIDKLKEHAGREHWVGLSNSIKGFYTARNEIVKAHDPEASKEIIKKLEANRALNFAHAEMLRNVAFKAIEHWLQVVSEPDELGRTGTIDPKSLREMANALATIHELTYRALGDCEAKRDPSQPDRPAGSPHITINLPGVLVTPRGSKTIDVNTTNSSVTPSQLQ